MKIIITHDELYLKENRYNKPKGVCKFIEERTFKKKKKVKSYKNLKDF
tara:strand:+ start:173 stop:316 length:144 start_codon:yes stop_codon:yes gene_type:complete